MLEDVPIMRPGPDGLLHPGRLDADEADQADLYAVIVMFADSGRIDWNFCGRVAHRPRPSDCTLSE